MSDLFLLLVQLLIHPNILILNLQCSLGLFSVSKLFSVYRNSRPGTKGLDDDK